MKHLQLLNGKLYYFTAPLGARSENESLEAKAFEGDLSHSLISMGYFDGLHLGHAAVLKKMAKLKQEGDPTILVSFYDPNKYGILTTEHEKAFLLRDSDLDFLLSVPIQKDKQLMEEAAFIKNLLKPHMLVSGETIAGCSASEYAEVIGADKLEQIEAVEYNGIKISSDNVIETLNIDFSQAIEMLGHPLIYSGVVCHGKAFGRTVGMPTANLDVDRRKLNIPLGVYATMSYMTDQDLPVKGLTNFGTRPSVDDFSYITIETFMLDFHRDIYDHEVFLMFYEFIRGIRKFANLQEVKEQVDKDIQQIRKALEQHSDEAKAKLAEKRAQAKQV